MARVHRFERTPELPYRPLTLQADVEKRKLFSIDFDQNSSRMAFLVGLDIVGDKILEINVFTPGGLWGASNMYRTDFAETVIVSLESKDGAGYHQADRL